MQYSIANTTSLLQRRALYFYQAGKGESSSSLQLRVKLKRPPCYKIYLCNRCFGVIFPVVLRRSFLSGVFSGVFGSFLTSGVFCGVEVFSLELLSVESASLRSSFFGVNKFDLENGVMAIYKSRIFKLPSTSTSVFWSFWCIFERFNFGDFWFTSFRFWTW